MTDLNKESEVNLRFEQDDGAVWVFDGDSQFGTEISHLMMMHADEYNEDELRVICHHAACEIDRLRAELEKAKAQAVPVWISTDFRKPNDHDCVDILINDARRIVDAVYLDGKFFIFPPFSKEQWTEVNNKVTHWMHRVYVVSESGAEG